MQTSITRRSVLQFAGVAAAVATTSSLLSELARADTVSGDMYWELVRGKFIFPETAIPMNSANLCPSFQALCLLFQGLLFRGLCLLLALQSQGPLEQRPPPWST